MKPLTAVGGGVAGAVAVTLLHESVRRLVPKAPRLDLLGMNAISKGLQATGQSKPGNNRLFTWALAGDLVSNAIYYSMAGVGKEKNIWLRSTMLGLAAGIGAVALPGPLGLEERHTNKSLSTKLLTIGLYVAGALVTAVISKTLASKSHQRNVKRKQEWERKLVTSAMG